VENLKKKTAEDVFIAVWMPVKAYLCKQHAQSLLNKIMMSQAFHNGIDLVTVFKAAK